jgi:hypothetical protein
MSFVFRLAVFLPVLFLIAIVVMGQQQSTAAETLRAALTRTIRWVGWTFMLLLVMSVLDVLVIGW